MLTKITKKLAPYLLPAIVVGGCLGSCLLLPKREHKPQKFKSDVKTTEFLGISARVYQNELNYERANNRQYVDFHPFGSLDIILFENQAQTWYDWRADDRFNFSYLEANARERGLIE